MNSTQIEDKDIAKEIYEKTWGLLKDNSADIDYQQKLKEFLEQEVSVITKGLTNEGINVTQGILYVNSVVILYDGRIAVYFGEKWNQDNRKEENIRRENWINRKIFEQEKANTEFQNILSLCNKKRAEIPDGKFPVLVFGENVLNYESIQIKDYQLPTELVDNISELYKKTDDIFLKRFKTLELFKKGFLEKYNIEINDESAKKLLLNPLRVATKYNAPNLFYIYDYRDVDDPGGIVFVANVSDELDSTKIQNILKKLQLFVCNFILTPILIAEGRRLSRDLKERAGERPYIFRFFKEEEDEDKMETRIPLIHNIRNLKLQGSDVFSQKAEEVRKDLQKLFTSVSGPSGKAMKDYGAFSEEVFLVTLQLWDDLDITSEKVRIKANGEQIKKIEDFRESHGNLKPNEKLLIDLLFTALNFEPAMRFIASYREHFIHCFHTFCVGFWLLCLKKQNDQYLFASYCTDPERLLLLKSWFLAGMFHDIGIPIQKAGDYLQTLAELLVQPKELRLFLKWSDLMANPYFHEVLFSEKFIELGLGIVTAKNDDDSLGLLRLNHKSVQLLLEKATHPVLGSLILYKNIKAHSNQYKNHSQLLHHIIMPVLVHHIWNDEWKEKGYNEGKDWELKNFERYPIAYLLILCDAISQLERRFEDTDPDANTPPIRLCKLADPDVHRDDNNQFYPECNLVYGVKSEDEAREYLKYYQGPFNVISCGNNPILKVTISYDLNNPTSFGKPFIFKTP